MAQYLARQILALAILLSAFGIVNAEEFRLPGIFSDHMVLQRDQPLPIWGWAPAGSKVAVRFKGQTLSTSANASGKWRVTLDPLEADSSPSSLSVSCHASIIEVSNVLVGDVWLCSGQSNMEWPVYRASNANEEIAQADHPHIRHIATAHTISSLPMKDADTSWEACSPATVKDWTAIGYYFGLRMNEELDVPIGLLNCTWGGTRIEPWISAEGYAQVPELKTLSDQVQTKRPDSEIYQRMANAYIEDVRNWINISVDHVNANTYLVETTPFPDAIRPYTTRNDPTTLFNGQIAPFVPYAIRGVIWYQGESNRQDGEIYFYKMRALIEGFRASWSKADLPFYYVQIAPHRYGDEYPYALPELWEAQGLIEQCVDNTGMVVISDVGDIENIHPSDKRTAGNRLAEMTLNQDFDRKDLIDSGPRFHGIQIIDDQIRVKFSNVAEGLRSRTDSPLTWFEIAGVSSPWTQAKAEIVAPDTVTVSSEKITDPVAIRFAWHKIAEPNLINSRGLPASSFRAGNPPELGTLLLCVPESRQYTLVYEKDLNSISNPVQYEVDHSDSIRKFDRIAYFLELGEDGEPHKWVYVSMEAFTQDPTKIGIPTIDTKAIFQRPLNNLTVISNVSGIPNVRGLPGHIEFWPNDYSQGNVANVPGATNQAYDTGDAPSPNGPDGYGSMQIHLTDPTETLFAINNWKSSIPDIGIGTNHGGREPDWTYAKTADRYTFKKLKVLVRPVE